MTFVPVAWTNGDIVTEVKMDQMVANDVHLRVETDYKYLMTQGGPVTGNHAFDSASVNMTYCTQSSGNGDHVSADNDISSLTDGTLYTVTVSGNGFASFEFRFLKTPDMERLTYFATLSSASDGGGAFDLTVSSITVIGHRVDESWTA